MKKLMKLTNTTRLAVLTLLIGSLPLAAIAVFGPDFERNVEADVIRAKRTRTEGGDFDDKLERISMRVKLTNSDVDNAYKDYKGRILVFSESQRSRGIFKVVIKQEFPISVEPRSEFEFQTKEIVEGWDNTNAVWGYRYRGWVLDIRSPEGETVLVKSSSPRYEKALAEVDKVSEGSHLNRSMKPVKGSYY